MTTDRGDHEATAKTVSGTGDEAAGGPAEERVTRRIPGPGISPLRQALRYWFAWAVVTFLVRALFRVRTVGLERLPAGPSVLCFNHQSWADPLIVVAALPPRPRLYLDRKSVV